VWGGVEARVGIGSDMLETGHVHHSSMDAGLAAEVLAEGEWQQLSFWLRS
jgi:hypothetical protein